MAEKINILKFMAFGSQMRLDALPPEQKWRFDVFAKYFGRIAEASEKGEPVNWSSYAGVPEIYHESQDRDRNDENSYDGHEKPELYADRRV